MKTREQWLNAAAEKIRERFTPEFQKHFGDEGLDHLDHLKVSTGFPSRGGLTTVIGQCWKAAASADETTHHIFINPRLEDIVEVVATLAHEMIHAADDGEHQHSGPFVRCARDIGLEGKATATFAGEEFAEFARSLGADHPYPHVGLVPLKTEKKQGTRMLKLEAACCGYVVRTTKKWIEVGYPACPCGNDMEDA